MGIVAMSQPKISNSIVCHYCKEEDGFCTKHSSSARTPSCPGDYCIKLVGKDNNQNSTIRYCSSDPPFLEGCKNQKIRQFLPTEAEWLETICVCQKNFCNGAIGLARNLILLFVNMFNCVRLSLLKKNKLTLQLHVSIGACLHSEFVFGRLEQFLTTVKEDSVNKKVVVQVIACYGWIHVVYVCCWHQCEIARRGL
ncbi:hypothetical protein HELRODRAFT_176893 [Helobdella robusta]|uniref:Uncharacterized protein n=1 Tax=Helobdella robusta TaxID=6412 RepID=T1FB10_HELRO|nr:hypothetical protein HELRODRAFT_176893 [Helobdella robusta]ESN98426.1 hypothetical protein HELRODRAFT_176893 [Helobdella robusta]